MHVTIDLEGSTLADLRRAVAALQDLDETSTFVVTTGRPADTGGALRGHHGGTRFGSPLASLTATTPPRSAS